MAKHLKILKTLKRTIIRSLEKIFPPFESQTTLLLRKNN